MRQAARLIFFAVFLATPAFAQTPTLNVYENFEGGTNGQALTTTILNAGLVCNSASGVWTLTGNAPTQMQVSTAAEAPLPTPITACGQVFNPPDGTRGITYNLNNSSTGYAKFAWTATSKNASLGVWFKTDLPTSDTNYHSMLAISDGTGDFVGLMIHNGFFYLEAGVNPNGNPNVGSFYPYTANKWYWVTEQFQAFVSSSSMHSLAIYDCGTPQAPVLPCTQLSLQKKFTASFGTVSPNFFVVGKDGDTGTPNNLVYYDNLLGDTTGQTFPILPNSGPLITGLSQSVGAIGTSITISGANFGSPQGTSTVAFNGTAATPSSWSAASIVVPVPAGATTGNVVVTVNGAPSNGVNFTVTSLPTITSLTPVSGPVGTPVTISGANFGSTQQSSTVTFNGIPATPTSWSDTSIAVPVPVGAASGSVAVNVAGVASNGVNFNVTSGTPITLVQHTNLDAGTTTKASLAFKSNNTAGNWIAVVVRAGSASSQAFTVTDSNGNTYRSALQLGISSSSYTFAIFYAENIKGGTNTITVSDTVSGPVRFAISEYSGVATANSLDGTPAMATGTSTSPNSGNVTTTASGDLLLGAIVTHNSATFVAGGGYTIEDSVPAEPNTKLTTEDQIQLAARSVSATADLGASDTWGAGLAAFKPATVGVAGTPSSITATAGTPQSATVGAAFVTQLQATVKDSFGNPVNNATVTFTAPSSGASGTFAGGVNTAITNAQGIATAAVFTASGIAGIYTVAASVSGVGTSASFSLTNRAGAAASVAATAGTPQSTTISTAFAAQMQAMVVDSFGNPVSGATVTFGAPSSGPSGTFAGGVNTATTNAQGIAIAPVFTANSIAGSYTVTPAAAGATTTSSFSLTNLAGGAASVTAIAGTPQSATIGNAFPTQLQVVVKDVGNNAVSGVTVTFVAPASGASGTFAGGVNTATTNAQGIATAASFSANGTAGTYTVMASVSGVGTSSSFSLTNLAGAAASIAATAGTPQSASINTGFATPLQATVKDSGNNTVSGVTVTFTAPTSGASGTFAGGANTATTNAQGIATAPGFTANSTVGGPYTVTAAVSGVLNPANFLLTNLGNPPANIAATAGTPQSATINAPFAAQLQVTVTDSASNPVGGVTVTFTAPTSGASGTYAGGINTATTNASGVATSAVFTANSTAGAYTVTASVVGVATPANFSLTNLAGAPASITATAGTPQSASVNTSFTTQLQATVKDSGNNAVSGVTVTFTAPAGGASAIFVGGVNIATTNSLGVAIASVVTANRTAGAYTVTASVAGVATPSNFSLTNLAGAPASISATAGTPQSANVGTAFVTQLQATVADSFNNSVSGVTVTFTAPTSGASGTFAGGINTATTNAQGVATAPIFTASSTAGAYTVTASVAGVASPASFSLTNLATPTAKIALVQHTSKDAGSTTSSTLAFANPNTAGNWIAVCVRAGNSSAQVFTVKDSSGNTYHQAFLLGTSANPVTFAIFYAENIKGGANTITVSDTVSGPFRFAILEYSGVATANSFEAASTGQGSGTAPNSGSVTTTSTGDLLVAEIVTTNTATFTAGASYTPEAFVPAEPGTKLLVEDQQQAAPGTVSAGASLAASDNWGAGIAAFRSVSGAAQPIAITVSPGAASVATGSGTQNFTVSLVNDLQHQGVAWSLSGAGCSGVTCGSLTNTTAFSATYSAPANVPSPATVTLTATAVADNTRTATATITVIQGALTVALSPKRAAVTMSFAQAVQFTATVTNDPANGGVTYQVDGSSGGNSSTGTISPAGVFTPGTQPGQHVITAVSVSNSAVSASSVVAVTDLTGVLTYHNDIARTGQNLQEYALTTSNVNSATFGKAFSCSVDGFVFAAPLYVANLAIGGQTRNVVFIATSHDSVYAFDADSPSCVKLWNASFLSNGVATVLPADVNDGSNDMFPEIGITSTPVIDPTTNIMYVEAKTKDSVSSGCSAASPCYFHYLHALDLLTGAEKSFSPVLITTPGFDPRIHHQRPALLLANGLVYLGFGSHADANTYRGWLMAYDAATLTQKFVLPMTAFAGNKGGVWGSGAGPAADASGNIYVSTGNGVYDGASNFGDTVLKLSSTGSILDWFTPFNQSTFASNDIDLGSSSVVILPASVGSTAHPHLALATGKVSILYLLDIGTFVTPQTTAMGKFNSTSNNDVQEVTPVPPPNTTMLDGGNFGSPAYWNGNIYSSGVSFPLSQFQIANGVIATPQVGNSSNKFPLRGATPVVSASGATNGIVWILDLTGWQANTPAILDAYDATNVGTLLYSSPSTGAGAAGPAVKFTIPVVANGKVYVGGQFAFTVFALSAN